MVMAASALAASVTCISQPSSWRRRIRRLVALSSTTRACRPLSTAGDCRTEGRRRRAWRERGDGEVEGAAGAVDAVDAQGGAHGLDQSVADGQSEPGAAVGDALSSRRPG